MASAHQNQDVTRPMMAGGLVMAGLNIALAWPGVMTRDSFRQYTEARSGNFTDWHPPIMAWLWRGTLPVFDSGAAFLIAHCLLYWGAIALIAAGLWRYRGPRWGAAIVVIGLLPPFVVMNAFVWKDTGMATALLAAFALILHDRLRLRRLTANGLPADSPAPQHLAATRGALAALLLFYAILVRSNGVIAAAPILVWWLAPPRWHPVALVALCLVMMPVGIVGAGVVNHRLLHAHASNAYNSLKVYDVAGVAHVARDVSAYPVRPPLALVDRCYDVRQWDWIGRGECADLLSLKVKGAQPWVRSLMAHPVAYALHRLAHYNQELFLWVPYDAFRYRDATGNPLFDQVRHASGETAIIAMHGYLASFPLFSPALFLVLALGGLAVVAVRRPKTDTDMLTAAWGGAAILCAALFYQGAFLLIGVANMWRYEFFPEIATLTGVVLVASDQDYRAGLPAIERVTLVAFAAVLAIVTVARVIL